MNGRTSEFTYFPAYLRWARFTAESCDCGKPCLLGSYFDNPDAPRSVCLHQLVAGEVRVDVPTYVRGRLERSVRAVYPTWTEEHLREHIERAVDELSRTPPIPWIQNNLWPAHHGNFCRYLGEWDNAKLSDEARDSDGKAYLMSILEEPEGIEDPEVLWREIADGWTIAYVFECVVCRQRIAIDQSYVTVHVSGVMFRLIFRLGGL